MSKHTPGPWTTKPTDNGDVFIYSETVRCIRPARVHNLDARGETQANARLMAASPDLLEALRWAVVYLETFDAGVLESVAGVCIPDMDRLRKAINKAEGK